MRTYLDTSVAIALVFREKGWEQTAHWLSLYASERLWSTYGRGEFTDVVARRVRGTALSALDGQATLSAAYDFFAQWQSVATSPDDIELATAFITDDFGRAVKLPDAIHIATARRCVASLITHDRQQATAARAIGLDVHLSPEVS